MHNLIQVQPIDFHTVSVYKVIRAGNCTSSLYFFQPVTNLLLEECLLLIPIAWLPICSFLWQHSDFCVHVYEYHLLDSVSLSEYFFFGMYFSDGTLWKQVSLHSLFLLVHLKSKIVQLWIQRFIYAN